MPKRGLPDTLRMRHDAHYVETLAASAGDAGRPHGADRPVDPNPDQPRQAMGDLAELIAVGHRKGHHRAAGRAAARRRATRSSPASAATTPPSRPASTSCRSSSATSTTREMLELALVENIQRKDLTPFEESEALQSLAQKLRLHARGPGQAAGQVAHDRSPKSLSLNGIPPEVRKVCRLAGINSKSLLLQVVRQGDAQKMLALVEKITSKGRHPRTAPQGNAEAASAGRPKAFVFAFRPPNKAFNLRLNSTRRRPRKTRSSRRSRASCRNFERRRTNSRPHVSRRARPFRPTRRSPIPRHAHPRHQPPSTAYPSNRARIIIHNSEYTARPPSTPKRNTQSREPGEQAREDPKRARETDDEHGHLAPDQTRILRFGRFS